MSKYGFVFAFLTALLWGIAPILDKVGLIKVSPLVGVTLRSLSITVILLVTIFATGNVREFLQVDSKTVCFIVSGGILAGLIGQWTYFKALKYWEASRVVPIVGSYPLFAFLLSLLLLGEKLTIGKGLGVVFVIFGIFLLR